MCFPRYSRLRRYGSCSHVVSTFEIRSGMIIGGGRAAPEGAGNPSPLSFLKFRADGSVASFGR